MSIEKPSILDYPLLFLYAQKLVIEELLIRLQDRRPAIDVIKSKLRTLRAEVGDTQEFPSLKNLLLSEETAKRFFDKMRGKHGGVKEP